MRGDGDGDQFGVCLCAPADSVSLTLPHHLLDPLLLYSRVRLAWGQSGLALPALVHASGLFLSAHPSGLAFKSLAFSDHLIIPTDGDNCEAEPRDQSHTQGDSGGPV